MVQNLKGYTAILLAALAVFIGLLSSKAVTCCPPLLVSKQNLVEK